MYTVKIMNEFIHSPIWVYDGDYITDEPTLIANDSELQDLCIKAENMFSSYYDFSSHDEPCRFIREKEKAEKNIMLDLVSRIKDRLNELNDGSYIIEDLETERLNNL
jgi:hypothetical protein